MSVPREPAPGTTGSSAADEIRPLPGEPGIPDVEARVRQPLSRKGLLAVALLLLSIAAAIAFGLARLGTGGRKAEDALSTLASNRPVATTSEPRRLELQAAPLAPAPASAPRIPALVATPEELAEPIGVRRTGQASPGSGSPRPMLPEDAPVMLVTSRPAAMPPASPPASPPAPGPAGARADAPTEPHAPSPTADPLAETRQNLDAYQRQLQGLLDNLARGTSAVLAPPGGAPPGMASIGVPSTAAVAPPPGGTPVGGLFGGSLPGAATSRVAASTLGNRSLVLPKGTAFTCALKTKVISAASGLVGCQVQRNVFGDDGRVLLIERGSHLDGEYRIASVRPGTVRIPVVWTRVRTPHGVTVDIDSPGTGALGESGIDGYVDNRWVERIGAAMLLSLIDDSVKLIIQNQASETNGSRADTIVLPSTTAGTSKLAEKVLESTIGISPLIHRNQGGIVGIYVARDVDFSSVYELRPTALDALKADRP